MSNSQASDDLLRTIPGLAGSASPRRSRRVPIWLIVLIVTPALALAGFVFYLLVPLEAPIPDRAGAAYAGLEQGYTEQGFPRLGSADAPIQLEIFSSYACPHCRAFHEERFPSLLDLIAAGQVQFIFVPIAHIGPGAGNAARAVLCAGEQGRLWAMHDTLYDWQGRFVASIFHTRRIKMGAENLGLDTIAFNECLDSAAVARVLEAARQEFDRRGLTGTPSLFLNGERVRDYRALDELGQPVEGENDTPP